MTRSEARTAEAWRGYDRAALVIALLVLLALLLLWWLGYGPNAAGCCGTPVASAPAAAPAVVAPAAPPPAPAAAPVPATAPVPAPSKAEPPPPVAAAPTPPEPAKVEAPKASAAPAVDCGKLVGGVTVRFATGSAALTPDSRATLDRTLGCVTDASYEVAGHTDSVGNAAANLTLSKARADAVVAYLRTQGLDTSRMTTVGFGQTRPIADNATEEGRAQNRRISFARRP